MIQLTGVGSGQWAVGSGQRAKAKAKAKAKIHKYRTAAVPTYSSRADGSTCRTTCRTTELQYYSTHLSDLTQRVAPFFQLNYYTLAKVTELLTYPNTYIHPSILIQPDHQSFLHSSVPDA